MIQLPASAYLQQAYDVQDYLAREGMTDLGTHDLEADRLWGEE